MRYYLDTEFHERPHTIDLISIAVVAEDGREFYCESSEYDQSTASEWLKRNVLPRLWSNIPYTGFKYQPNVVGGAFDRKTIGEKLVEFVGNDNPEFWGYYCSYDWVVTCWLFGSMINLPNNFPMYCCDLKQLKDTLKGVELPKHNDEHHALSDARWTKLAHTHLMYGF